MARRAAGTAGGAAVYRREMIALAQAASEARRLREQARFDRSKSREATSAEKREQALEDALSRKYGAAWTSARNDVFWSQRSSLGQLIDQEQAAERTARQAKAEMAALRLRMRGAFKAPIWRQTPKPI